MGLRLRLLLSVLLVTVAGCRGQAPRTAEDALTGAEAAYSLACVALEVGDAAAAAWLDSLEQPDAVDIARGEQLVAALQVTHDALVTVRADLLTGRDALDELREVVVLLRGVADLLGEQAPPPLVTALDAADRLIGGGQ
jgi:hypothetical protein